MKQELFPNHFPTPLSEKLTKQFNNSHGNVLAPYVPYQPSETLGPQAQIPPVPFGGTAPSQNPPTETLNIVPVPRDLSYNLQKTSEPASEPTHPVPNIEAPDRSQVTNETYLGINLFNFSDPDELLDVYGGYNSVFEGFQEHEINYGPYSWLSFIRKDRFCNVLWDFITLNGKKTGEPQLIPEKNPQTTTADHEKDFQNLSMKREEVTPFNSSELRAQVNKKAISLGLTVYEGDVDPTTNLLERIRISLPTKKCIWILISRFFRRVYPYVPLLDETYFRKRISLILGPETFTDDHYDQINIKTKNDFASLGILLILLRITYLSSFSNRNNVNQNALSSLVGGSLAEVKYILSNPINIDVISVARLCLAEFDLYKKNALVVLQCVVFLRMYGCLSPEDGDGSDGNDGHVLNSVCIQVSYCMGINRDQVNYKNDPKIEKTNNIKRKIWAFLKVLDLHLSFEFGFPPAIQGGFSDVQTPYFGPNNSNIFDINLERAVADYAMTADDIIDQFRSVVAQTLSIEHKPSMKKITESISQLEIKMRNMFGSLSDYTKPVENLGYSFVRVLKCKLYLSVRIFTLSFFYHLSLNYELKNMAELCYFYRRKIFSIHVGEILPEVLSLILHNDKNFDSSSTVADLILNPVIEIAIHKGNQFCFSLWIRLLDIMNVMQSDVALHNENMKHNSEYNLKFTQLGSLVKMLEKIVKFSVKCVSRLSLRYYYAWRLSKTHRYLCNIISSDSFQMYTRSINHKCMDFSSEQLEELIDMGKAALHKMKWAVQKDHKMNQIEITAAASPAQAPQTDGPQTEGQPTAPSDEVPVPELSTTVHSVPQELQGIWDPATTSLSFDLEDFGFVSNGNIDDLWKHISDFTGVVDQKIDFAQQYYS